MPTRTFRSRTEFAVVMAGGVALTAVAGYVNAIALLLGSDPVTHLTGTVSRLSVDLGQGDREDALLVAGLVASFVVGAVLSGVILGASTLRFGRRYGVAILLEAALIAAAALAVPVSLNAGALLAASAAGLQNAMASSYRSLIIRTTHVTGLLTDLGFMAGQRLGGHDVGLWRFGFVGMLVAGFVAGGIAGVSAHAALHEQALWIPAGLLALGGAGYFFGRKALGSTAP
ncbi:MAG: YoaK family protein [Phycisphaerales bacterium JB040]